jgi:hypothetical protein
MRQKKSFITYLVAVAIAIAIIGMSVSVEMSNYGPDTPFSITFLSDGCFLTAVVYLGFGILTFISEAGNFYSIQYLGYSMVYTFSFRKKRFEDRKDYYTYCSEKQAKQKERGKSSAKWAMIFVGLGCLAASGLCAVAAYKIG